VQIKVRLQPIDLAPATVGVGKALMAEEAWTHGPPKPRNVTRDKEVPAESVDLESLAERYHFLEILPPQRIATATDIAHLPVDVAGYIIDFDPNLVNWGLLGAICNLQKPILPSWDRFGYAWSGRLIRDFVEQNGGVCLVPFGAEDIKRILRVLRAASFLRHMRVLYIGNIPPYSVRNAEYNFDNILQRIGPQFYQVNVSEFEDTIERITNDEVGLIGKQWIQEAEVLDGREKGIDGYAKIYLALRKLMDTYNANAITMECPRLSSIDHVPCYSFAKLIDEGIPAGCEGDSPALICMSILMAITGGPVLMGNLFENTTHEDVENNIIVINHDVVPPSMGVNGKRVKLRDFHGTSKGLTGFVELKDGARVTIAGMNRDINKLWYSSGRLLWTEDTVHCRTSIGVEVKDAKRIAKEAFGHHQCLVYGDWTNELKMLAKVLKIATYPL